MALRFSPPPFDERRQAPDLSASFDAFMNAYARSKQLGMAEQQAKNQQTTFDQAQADRAIQNQMTWGTANPTPEYVSAANRAAQTDFQGPILPSMQVALENIKRQKEMRDLESRGVKAKIGSEEASAFKDTALGMQALRGPAYSNMPPQVENINGINYLVTSDQKGIKHYNVQPDRQPNQNEYIARGYADKATEADKALEMLTSAGFDATSLANFAASKLPDVLQGGDVKGFNNAKKLFANSIARRESGATIKDDEMARYDLMYFPSANDTPEVIAQKAENRRIAIQNLANEGKRAPSALTQPANNKIRVLSVRQK